MALSEILAAKREEEFSMEEWLEAAKKDASLYATAPERLLKAIGDPEIVDTSRDQRLSRIFMNRTIRVYPAFADFYGMEAVIENIVGFIRNAAQGLMESRQILHLLGPVGGGKSSLAERIKTLMEKEPISVLVANGQMSPVFESPLGLFENGDSLEQEYGIPARYLIGVASPWAMKRLDEFGGDITRFRVRKIWPSRRRQIAIGRVEPGDANTQDISSLVGKIDIRRLEDYAQNDPDAYSFSGGLCRGNQGVLELVESFKLSGQVLNPLLAATQEFQYTGTEAIGAIPWQGMLISHCFSEDTELLTKDGWRGIDEVEIGDVVATINKDECFGVTQFEYQEVTDKIVRTVDEDLYLFSSKVADHLVTGGHTMLFRRGLSYPTEECRADEFEMDSMLIPAVFLYYPSEYDHFVDYYRVKCEKVHYSGRVWCVTVPNHTLVARRNGKVIITGNCNNSEYETFTRNKKNEAFVDRMTVVKVYYNLRVQEEQKIYKKLLKNSSLANAPCAPHTLEMLARFSVITRIAEHPNSTQWAKLCVYDGMSVKDSDPAARSMQEYRDTAGVDEGMDGISTRFAFKILAATFNYDPAEIAADPVHLMVVLEEAIKKEKFPHDVEEKYLSIVKQELAGRYVEDIGKEIQKAYLENYSDFGQNIFERYIATADAWVEDIDFKDPDTGQMLERDDLDRELSRLEKAASIANPKDFRNEIVKFALRYRSSHNGALPKWNSYEKVRDAIEKRMFSSIDDLLPVISFGAKSDSSIEVKHRGFVGRMMEIGYTERQVRRLTEWFMRVRKSM